VRGARIHADRALIVVAIVGILAAIGFALYVNVQARGQGVLDLPLTLARAAPAVPGPSSDLPAPGKMFSRVVRLSPPG
jgi:hypothetical protein